MGGTGTEKFTNLQRHIEVPFANHGLQGALDDGWGVFPELFLELLDVFGWITGT
jgi:hypothetical protein